MDEDCGHALTGQALVNEAPTGLHPSGFDPSCEVTPDAFMVEWVRGKETWVHCHADEPTARDQARIMKGTCTPLYKGASAAEQEVVAFLRGGGDRIGRQWYSWDSEMAGYAKSFADRIERGDHRA